MILILTIAIPVIVLVVGLFALKTTPRSAYEGLVLVLMTLLATIGSGMLVMIIAAQTSTGPFRSNLGHYFTSTFRDRSVIEGRVTFVKDGEQYVLYPTTEIGKDVAIYDGSDLVTGTMVNGVVTTNPSTLEHMTLWDTLKKGNRLGL